MRTPRAACTSSVVACPATCFGTVGSAFLRMRNPAGQGKPATAGRGATPTTTLAHWKTEAPRLVPLVCGDTAGAVVLGLLGKPGPTARGSGAVAVPRRGVPSGREASEGAGRGEAMGTDRPERPAVPMHPDGTDPAGADASRPPVVGYRADSTSAPVPATDAPDTPPAPPVSPPTNPRRGTRPGRPRCARGTPHARRPAGVRPPRDGSPHARGRPARGAVRALAPAGDRRGDRRPLRAPARRAYSSLVEGDVPHRGRLLLHPRVSAGDRGAGRRAARAARHAGARADHAVRRAADVWGCPIATDTG